MYYYYETYLIKQVATTLFIVILMIIPLFFLLYYSIPLAIELFVLRVTDSDYPFGTIKLFFGYIYPVNTFYHRIMCSGVINFVVT
jgi:hypothetical protein